jgi:hypothetical protein
MGVQSFEDVIRTASPLGDHLARSRFPVSRRHRGNVVPGAAGSVQRKARGFRDQRTGTTAREVACQAYSRLVRRDLGRRFSHTASSGAGDA